MCVQFTSCFYGFSLAKLTSYPSTRTLRVASPNTLFCSRSSRPVVFCKKGVVRNSTKFTGKHLCQSLFFNKVAGPATLLQKQTLAQMFSCGFCEISNNTFLHRTPLVTVSVFFHLNVVMKEEELHPLSWCTYF